MPSNCATHFGFLPAIIFLAAAAHAAGAPPDPYSRATIKEVYAEATALASRHPDVKKLLDDKKAEGLGLPNAVFRRVLWRAAQESGWTMDNLGKNFPGISQSLICIAGAVTKSPKLIYTMPDIYNSDSFEMLFDTHSGRDFGVCNYDPLDEDFQARLEQKGGRDYLVMERWNRRNYSDTSQNHQVIRVLIKGTELVEIQRRNVPVPMPSHAFVWLSPAKKKRIAAEVAATNTAGIEFPGIKAYAPEIYQEMLGLAARHGGLKERLDREDFANGISETPLSQALFYAACECGWELSELTGRFPALCRYAGVIGMADEGSDVPELVYHPDDGKWVMLLYESDAEMGGTGSMILPLYGEDKLRMEESNGRSYLIVDRSLYQDGGPERDITRYLTDGGKFVEKSGAVKK